MYTLISIIIPIYNAEKYIYQCISSILKQTWKHIEIILINDGSTDKSLEICQQLQQQDYRLIIINQENKGASIARLEGIKNSHGEYLIFVDSDDIVEDDYVELLYNALKKHHTMIATCNIIKHHEKEKVTVDRKHTSQVLKDTELHNRFFHYDFWGFPGKLYKKEVFDNIYFPKATINEDYVVMAQLFHKYKEIAYIDISLYHYLIHNNESLSNTRLSPKMLDEWTNKLWCYHFYKENAPKWEKHAEAQVAETCCKLIAAIGNNIEYKKAKKEMQSFLRKHFCSLLFNPNLIKGIKGIMCYRIIQ